jgi:hypothetical protein
MAYKDASANISRQKKNGVYLLLPDNRRQPRVLHRLHAGHTSRHPKQNNGKGCEWTRLHKPIKILIYIKTLNIDHQKELTLETMRKYGRENVRGYLWTAIEIKKPGQF